MEERRLGAVQRMEEKAMLRPDQEAELTERGDCQSHYHSSDRMPTQDTILQIQRLNTPRLISSNFVANDNSNYLLMDTSSGNVSVQLPAARNGREIVVMKNTAGNYVQILPLGSDKILGLNELKLYNYGDSARLKAIPGGWFVL